jgi:spermidine synthase
MRGEEAALHIRILDTVLWLYRYVPGYDLIELDSDPPAVSTYSTFSRLTRRQVKRIYLGKRKVKTRLIESVGI